MNQQLEQLLEHCTVKLIIPDQTGWGTGFFVAPELILTCYHVVKDAKNTVHVCQQNQPDFAEAVIMKSFPELDLALLRFDSSADYNFPCVYLDSEVKSGDELYLFGFPDEDYPNGCPATFTCEGFTGDKPPLLKFKLGQVRPGMSGSPLLNQRTGKVCGIVKFTRDRSIDLGGGAVPTDEIFSQFPPLKKRQQAFHSSDDRWIRNWDESESETIKSSGATFTTLITTPPNLNNWIGREDEINELQTWLAKTEIITIGIQGLGGVGKSTLAAYLYENTTNNAGFEGKFWADVSRKTDFRIFAEKIITEFGGQVTHKGDITELVDNLLCCLNQRRYLLIVDNLETLLDESREWEDSAYEQFFSRWIKQGRKSTLLLTTQEKPIFLESEPCWRFLKGMKTTDGVKFLQRCQIRGNEAQLKTFVDSVDGHPLTLELVAGLLRADWDSKLSEIEKLGLKQSELVDKAQGFHRSNPDARLLWILEQHFQRLTQEQQSLLFDLSVYRQPFDREAALCMLTSNEEKYQQHIKVQELHKRSLLLKVEDEKYQFQPLVRQHILQQQSRDLTFAHQKAFEYYRSHLKELSSEKTIDDVTEYLEAFYHSCQIKQYDQAYRILNRCYNFVGGRGYYSILVSACEELVKKWLPVIEHENKSSLYGLFTQLGSAYVYLGISEKAIYYHQKSLSIARKFNEPLNEAGALCNLGHAYGMRGQKQNYQQALKCYQQALPISKEIGSLKYEGNIWGGLGSIYKSSKEYEQAIDCYERWQKIVQNINDKSGEALAFGGLGKCYESLEEYKRAIYFYKRELKTAETIRDLRLQAGALGSLGRIHHYSLQDYEKGIEYYQQAVPIYQKIDDSYQYGGCLCNMGNAYRSLEKYEEAIKCYNQALPILQAIGERDFEANTLKGLGATYESLRKYPEAIKYYQQWRDIARKIDDNSREASALSSLGSIYDSLRKYPEAIECYEQAVILYREIDDSAMEGGSLCNLGNAYSSLENYEEAIKYYKEALPILQQINHQKFEANTVSGLGNVYYSQGEHQEAINCHQKALRIRHKIGDRSGKIGSLWNLAMAYESLKMYQQAIKYYQQALKIARKIGDLASEGGSLCNLGHTYISMREYQEAINYCQQALPILRKISHLDFESKTLYNLVCAYESLEEYDEAIKYEDQKSEVERKMSEHYS